MTDVKTTTSKADSLVIYIQKIWNYRALILTFAKRDLKVKYAQTYFGVFWVILQPLPSVIVFTFFFERVIKINTGPLPYPVFALVGMVGWNYFSNLAYSIGNSLIESQHVLKKFYFPKLILALAKVIVGAVDFFIAFCAIVIAMIMFNVMPSYTIVFFPIFVLLNVLAGFAIGIWITALTFRFRDLQHVAPFVINFAIWLTPVFYPTTVLPQRLNYIMNFNPMALVVAGYRFALVGGNVPDFHLLISIIPTVIILALGLLYFRKVEDEIADFI